MSKDLLPWEEEKKPLTMGDVFGDVDDFGYDSLADNVDDFPLGTCNPNAPEECESCQ